MLGTVGLRSTLIALGLGVVGFRGKALILGTIGAACGIEVGVLVWAAWLVYQERKNRTFTAAR